MWGSATFAMAVSRSSMTVASVTVMAMNQGLMRGWDFGARHLGHYDVHQEQRNFVRTLAEFADGFVAIMHKNKAVAEGAENLFGHVAHAVVIFGDQDKFVAAARRGVVRSARRVGLTFTDRQMDVEGGARADFAVKLDEAAVLLHDAEDGVEAEASSLSNFLGGEKRLEDALHCGGVHACACVGDGELHPTTGTSVGVTAAIFFVEIEIARLDQEPGARGHGVARVEAEIHQHLLDLGRIGSWDGR